MDTTAQKQHKRCAGKGRFTVASKGTVTVNCSPTNLREAQFAYGDAFCISVYGDSSPGGAPAFQKLSGGATGGPGLRSCEFGGRLEDTKQRTFVYSKKGIRIGTFIKALVGPTGGVSLPLPRPAPAPAARVPLNLRTLVSTHGGPAALVPLSLPPPLPPPPPRPPPPLLPPPCACAAPAPPAPLAA